MTFGDAEFEQMKRVEGAVIKALMPFRENTPNGLVLFALIRVARVMLRLSPKKTQKDMLDACVPFLEGKTRPRGEESSILWTPGSDAIN